MWKHLEQIVSVFVCGVEIACCFVFCEMCLVRFKDELELAFPDIPVAHRCLEIKTLTSGYHRLYWHETSLRKLYDLGGFHKNN